MTKYKVTITQDRPRHYVVEVRLNDQRIGWLGVTSIEDARLYAEDIVATDKGFNKQPFQPKVIEEYEVS